jgi:hypothetical protein
MSTWTFLLAVGLALAVTALVIVWGQLNDAEEENDKLRRRNGELESWFLSRKV